MRLNSNAGVSGKISPKTHGTASGTSLRFEKHKDTPATSICATRGSATTKSKRKHLVTNNAHLMG
jgi:hypothetical protein